VTNNDEFPVWARSEIDRHRAEAAQLEQVLLRFLAARNSSTATTGRPMPTTEVGVNPPRPTMQPASKPMRTGRRTTKNEPIFAAFEKAGPQGMSMRDVERVAREAGLNTNPNALRALCWNGKKDGRLISLAAGRYAIAHPTETADPTSSGEPAASAREAHNQHREGDAGGGT
jgi:hypothetical protein